MSNDIRPVSSYWDRSDRGFTLVELLLSMAITSVILVTIVLLSGNVADAFTRSEGRLSGHSKARLALSYLSTDLESALFRGGAGEWLSLNPENVDDGGSPLADATRAGNLTFISASPDRPGGVGDVCAVSYRLAYQDPFAGTVPASAPSFPLFGFYRGIANPLQTWAGTDHDPNDPAAPSAIANADMQTNFWGSTAPVATDLLVTHVVDFSVALWYWETIPAVGSNPPSRQLKRILPDGIRIGDNTVTHHPSSATTGSICEYADLDHLEVTLTVLSTRGAKLVGAKPIDDLIQSEGMTFTRRIRPHFAGALVR